MRFEINKGGTLLANEKVGQNFKGNSYPYLASSYEQLQVTINAKTRALNPRLGSLPTIQEVIDDDGLLILSAISTRSELVYKDKETFNNFLKEEGLEWVFAAHKKRGLPEFGFTEVYQRFPKALVKVGEGSGQDKVLGLPMEWIALDNPYKNQKTIKLKLLWQGKPYINAHVNVFNKTRNTKGANKTIKTQYTTDDQGIFLLSVEQGGKFLINAVKMIEPNAEVSQLHNNAVWESLWASMTFEILVKK